MIVLVNVMTWVLIALFLWEVSWKGRVLLVILAGISILLPALGNEDNVHLFRALGLAVRVAIGCIYLLKQKLPVVS